LRGDAMKDAERDTGNIATVLAEQTSHSVQAIDLTLAELQKRVAASGATTLEQFRAAAGSEEMFRVLRGHLARLAEVDVVTLVAADGSIVATSRVFPARTIDLSDRDYFKHARDNRGARIFITTLINRLTGRPAIVFTRRLESAKGVFLGVALVNVEV